MCEGVFLKIGVECFIYDYFRSLVKKIKPIDINKSKFIFFFKKNLRDTENYNQTNKFFAITLSI